MISSTTARWQASVSSRRSTPAELPTIPGWQLVRRLGGGEMTTVYQARPSDAAETQPAGYALKTVAQAWQDNPLGAQLLCQEVRAARQVNSPHVVPILSANLRQTPQFIVMPMPTTLHLCFTRITL